MSAIPGLTETAIRAQALDESFNRGLRYAHSGAVQDLVVRERTLTAHVYGSESAPYKVSISFGPKGAKSATCTCPYDWGGWCKHIIAVLLVALRQPEQVEQRAPLAAQIAALNREQLATVLLNLAKNDSDIRSEIEAQLANVGSPRSLAAGAPRQPIDSATIHNRIDITNRLLTQEVPSTPQPTVITPPAEEPPAASRRRRRRE